MKKKDFNNGICTFIKHKMVIIRGSNSMAGTLDSHKCTSLYKYKWDTNVDNYWTKFSHLMVLNIAVNIINVFWSRYFE